MLVQNLLNILVAAVEHSDVNGIKIYGPSGEERRPFTTYKYLLSYVKHRSKQLEKLESIDNKVVLMYFADHFDNIAWFWAIIAAGGIPCICPPLGRDLDHCQKNVAHLQKLLGNPLVITTEHLASEFPSQSGLRVIKTGKNSNSWGSLNPLVSLSRCLLRQGVSILGANK